MQWQESIELEGQLQPHVPNFTSEQVADAIREKVKARPAGINKAFTDVDFARIGSVSKEDFRDILHKNVMRLSDEQVNCIIQHKMCK